MILADTAVWVDHLRSALPSLAALLTSHPVPVRMHPFVLGELACGNLRDRQRWLERLADLPSVTVARPGMVLEVIEHRRLMGRGIGYVDAHLLASALLDHAQLWTRDRRLAGIAAELGVGYVEPRPG